MPSRWAGLGAVSSSVLLTAAWLIASPTWTSTTRLWVVLAALAAHGAVLVLAARDLVPRAAVVAGIAVLLAVAVAVPPRDSNDVWGYVAYGRLVTEHGANPHRTAPAAFPDDPLLERMSPEYRDTPTLYGPAFTAVSSVGTAAAGDSPLLNRLYFQLLAAGAGALALWLVGRRTGAGGALAFVGLSPVFASTVNGAHLDVIVGALLLGAVLLADERRFRWVGAALAAAILVKLAAVLPAAALVLWSWRRRGTSAAASTASVGVPLVCGAYLLAGGLSALTPLREAARLIGSRGQAWELVRQSWAESYATTGLARAAELSHLEITRYATPVILAVAVVVLIRLTRDDDPAVPLVGGGLGFLFSSTYVLPWYSMWVLPAAATTWRSAIGRFALAQAGLTLLVYADPPGQLPPEGPLLDLSTRWLPLVGAVLAVTFVTWCFVRRRGATADEPEPTPALGLAG